MAKPTVHVRNDAPSKPQRANTKAKHMEYVSVPHPDKTSGYKGKLVPRTPKSVAASKKLLQQMNAPQNPATYIGG